MVHVNLLAWRQRNQQRQMRRWLWHLSLALLLAIGGLASWRLMLTDSNARLQQLAASWQEAVGQAQRLAQQYQAAALQTQQLRRQAAARQAKRQQLAQWQDLLAGLEESVPAHLWLLSLTHQTTGLRISGLSQRLEEVAQLHSRLSRHTALRWQPGALESTRDGLYRFSFSAVPMGEPDDVE